MTKEIIKNVVSLFGAFPIGSSRSLTVPFFIRECNIITNFHPTSSELEILSEINSTLKGVTLFSLEERLSLSQDALVFKQILHYMENFILGVTDTFAKLNYNDQVVILRYIPSVNNNELSNLVRNLIYSNAPIKNPKELVEIIKHFDIAYDLNLVKNNDVRVLLYVPGLVFESGDDAVRFLCHSAGSDLLIKDAKTIDLMKQYVAVRPLEVQKFLQDHRFVLAKVFNRHKRLILALKRTKTAGTINQIARLSKKNHVPIRESLSKNFVSKALAGEITDINDVLSRISVRDKFKYLNLLAFKKLRSDQDVFVIRNGKAFIKGGRKTHYDSIVNNLMFRIYLSLEKDLAHLKGKKIVLDRSVDYGLPVSRKQTLGNLPFGTVVEADGNEICSGIYWEDSWGARDLDLSTIDTKGNRVGWGRYSSYGSSNEIAFSGDIVTAHDGAFEFMRSPKLSKTNYGLIVNIFSTSYSNDGKVEAEVVVGNSTKKQWIDNVKIREKIKLDSKEVNLGFVVDGKFIVYQTRVSDRIVSGMSKTEVLIKKGLCGLPTVSKLLDMINVDYVYNDEAHENVDYNLSYSNFSYDKLESLLLPL